MKKGIALLAALILLAFSQLAAATPVGFMTNDTALVTAQTSTTAASGTVPGDSVVNVTWVPGYTGLTSCYLLMASAEVAQSSASRSINVNFSMDGLQVQNALIEPQTTATYYPVMAHNITCFTEAGTHNWAMYVGRVGTSGTTTIRNARVIAMAINNTADYVTNTSIATQYTHTLATRYTQYVNLTFAVPTGGSNYLIVASLEFKHGATGAPSGPRIRLEMALVGGTASVLTEMNMTSQSAQVTNFYTFMAQNTSFLAAGTYRVNLSVFQSGGTADVFRRMRISVINLTGYSFASNTSDSPQLVADSFWQPVTSVSMPLDDGMNFIAFASSTLNSSGAASASRVRNVLFPITDQGGPPDYVPPTWNVTLDSALTSENFSFFALWNDTWDQASEPKHLMNLTQSAEVGGTNPAATAFAHITAIWVPIPQGSACGTLTDASVTMTQSVSQTSTGSCFTIGAASVNLDCAGYTISGPGSTSTGAGVRNPGYDGVTVRNCRILNFLDGIRYTTGASTGADPDDGRLWGNTMYNNTRAGIYLNGSNLVGAGSTPAYRNELENNTAWNSTFGFLLTYNDNMNLTNNTAQNNTVGFYLNRTAYTIFFNATADNNSQEGIYVSGLRTPALSAPYDSGLMMANITAMNNTIGISLNTTSNVTITNASVRGNRDNGILLRYADNTTIFNVTITNNTDEGIWMIYSNNASIWTVGLNNNSQEGIFISTGSWNNSFRNITIGNSTYGFYLNDTFNNTISNSSTTNATNGIYVSGGGNNSFLDMFVLLSSTGVSLTSQANNNTFTNISVVNSSIAGFYISGLSQDNRIINTSASGTAGPVSFGSATGNPGFYITGASNNTFINISTFNNSGDGFAFYLADNNTIVNSTSFKNSCTSCDGFQVFQSDNNTFYNNTVFHNGGAGFYITSESTSNRLWANKVTNSTILLDINTGRNNSVINNSFWDPVAGGDAVHIVGLYNYLYNNSIYNGTTGVNISTLGFNTVANNSFVNNTLAVYASASSNNSISNNSFGSPSANPLFYNLFHVSIFRGGNNTVANNTLDYSPVLIAGLLKPHVLMTQSYNNSVFANYMTRGQSGIISNYSNFSMINNNTVQSTGVAGQASPGIWLNYSYYNQVTNNSLDKVTGTGIYAEGSWYNSVFNNTFTTIRVAGSPWVTILLNASPNNNVSNNLIASSDAGIFALARSDNLSIINNTFRSMAFGASIWLDTNNGSWVQNNLAASGAAWGFNVSNSDNVTFSNNTARSNTMEGFYITFTPNATLENNSAYTNGLDGFRLEYANRTRAMNNTAINNSGAGVNISNAWWGYLQNFTARNNSLHGFMLTTSQNNTIGNLTTAFNDPAGAVSSAGLYLFTSINNTFVNLNSTGQSVGTGDWGINLFSSNTNFFYNATVENDTIGVSLRGSDFNQFYNLSVVNETYGIVFQSGADSNYFINSSANLKGGLVYSVWVSLGTNNTFLNCTINRTRAFFEPITLTTRDAAMFWWYGKIDVRNYAGTGLEGAEVNITNITVQNVFSNLTMGAAGGLGLSNWTILREGFMNYSSYPQLWNETNHTFNATYLGVSNWTNVTMNESRIVIVYLLLVNCGDTLTSNTTLGSNVFESTGGNCFTIGANYITLNCKNYRLEGIGGGTGVMNNGFDNVTVRNCRITNFTTAILYTNMATNGTMDNDTIWNMTRTAASYGIFVNTSSNFTLINNTKANMTGSGTPIYVNFSHYSQIINMTANATAGSAIYIISSNFTNITNSSGKADTGSGFSISDSSNTITNSTGISVGGGYGIAIYFSDNSIITNSTGIASANIGIYLSGDSGTITNSTGISTSGNSIQFLSSNSNTAVNCSFISTSGTAVNFSQSSYNQIINSSIRGGQYSAYVYSAAGPSLNNNITNTTLNLYNLTVVPADGSYLRVWWYGRLQAIDYGSNALEGALFNVSNSSAMFLYANLTEASGYSNWTLIQGQIITSAGLFQVGNHTFNASYTSFTNWTNASMNQSRTVTVYIKLPRCGDIYGSSTTLIGDLFEKTGGNCITIGANSITLDCSNYKLEGFGGGTGIMNNGFDNVTVRDCVIKNFTTAILYTNIATNGTMDNDTIWNMTRTVGSYGIFVNTSSNNTLINRTLANMTDNGYPIYFNNSHYAQIINVTANATTGNAIYAYFSNFTNITSSSGIASSGNGIQLTSSSNDTILNCTGVSTAASGNGISLSASTNATISNCTGIATSGNGIYLASASINNTITNSTGVAGTGYGIQLYYSSNNTLINTTGISTGTGGAIYLESSSNTTIANCTAIAISGNAIYLSSANNNTIVNTTGISTTTGYGFYLSLSNNNNITNSTAIATGASANGIRLSTSSVNTITNFTSIVSSGRGFYLITSSNNNSFINSTAIATTGTGIGLYTSCNNNSFINSTGIATSGNALIFSASNNNTAVNSTFISATGTAVNYSAASNNSIVNSSLSGGQYSAYVYSTTDPSKNNTLVNTTLNLYKLTVVPADGSFLRVWWYGRINVSDCIGPTPIEGAFFNMSNRSALIAIDYSTQVPAINLTEPSGLSNWTLLEGQIITSLGLFHVGNHTFNASMVGYDTNWTNATINESKTVLVCLPAVAAVSISFTVFLPGSSLITASNYTAPQNINNTLDIEFNVSNQSQAWANASVAPTTAAGQQNDGIPIFNYTNTGNVPINISLWFNGSSMPPGINVTASNGTGGGVQNFLTGAAGCTLGPVAGLDQTPNGNAGGSPTCKNMTNTPSRFISDLQPGQFRGLWVWAFYDNFRAYGGTVGSDEYTRNVTHASSNIVLP